MSSLRTESAAEGGTHEGGGQGLLWVLLAAALLFALLRPRAPLDYVRLVDWQTLGALAGLLAITQGVERSGMLQAAAFVRRAVRGGFSARRVHAVRA